MRFFRFASLSLATTIAVLLCSARFATAQTAALTTPLTPQEARKAQRKQLRAKKNAELNELEKNGYEPGSDNARYPEDIENAERETSARNAGKAASAP